MNTTPKARPCAYDKCGREFIPVRMGQKVCGPRCAGRLVKAKALAEKAAERAQTKARKDAVKKRSKWEDECRLIVQKIARLRDRHDGCISCHLPASYGDVPGSWGRQWHGSHFRSHGACSVLQFHLWNIHKACASCNKDKGGNIAAYRPRLVEKIGQDRVDWLDSQNGTFKPPVDYYIKFKRVMGKRLRRLERRVEQEKGE